MIRSPLLVPDDYFLSAVNPTATVDQRDLEAVSIRLLQTPEIMQARDNATTRWKTIVGRDMTAEALERFDELIEEYVFHYVAMAANSDANYPKVLGHLYGPPHEWFGMQVPGSRSSGGDGPDANYTIIPVDCYARFELHGRKFSPCPADVPIILSGNVSLTMTLGRLDWQDVQFAPDGTFVVTLDPAPANRRPNHIQTKPEARYLFIRDCRSDWRQIPNAYRIKRLDPPVAAPLGFQQIAERAAKFIVEDVPHMYWFLRTFAALEENTITAPFATGTIGGLVSQQISFARLRLSDDDAFVVTVGSGNASFRDLVLQDFWFRTFDVWRYQSSMNNSQGFPNPDGSVTYVISIRDPGVHNWLDPAGFHEVLVVHRWQGLTRDLTPETAPWARGELVRLRDLKSHLPAHTRWVSPDERKQQLADRAETFRLRYLQ